MIAINDEKKITVGKTRKANWKPKVEAYSGFTILEKRNSEPNFESERKSEYSIGEPT